MFTRKRIPYLTMAALAIGAIVLFILAANGAFDIEVWKRENPLVNPIGVVAVKDGALTLADGRVFRPAGIKRREWMRAEDFDNALSVMVAQGVVVLRDVGDGRAFLMAEPRFYNWCGTRNYNGNPFARWAGSNLQCPLSELTICLHYARADSSEPGLTPREQWRLDGAEELFRYTDEPVRIAGTPAAFRYDGDASYFKDFENYVEAVWKPPP